MVLAGDIGTARELTQLGDALAPASAGKETR
jgi:hypothetical protein